MLHEWYMIICCEANFRFEKKCFYINSAFSLGILFLIVWYFVNREINSPIFMTCSIRIVFSLFYLCYLFNYRTMLNIPKLIIVCCAVLSLRCVQATSPPQFLKDINGYRSACKSIGWEPKQGKSCMNILWFKKLSLFCNFAFSQQWNLIFYILFQIKSHDCEYKCLPAIYNYCKHLFSNQWVSLG